MHACLEPRLRHISCTAEESTANILAVTTRRVKRGIGRGMEPDE